MNMTTKPIIDPENMPMWVTAGFALALLALVVAFAGVYRTNKTLAITQAEVLMLNKKIQQVSKSAVAPAPVAAPAAAAAPATPAAPAAPTK